MPKDIKDKRVLLTLEFDAGPLAGKLLWAMPIEVR